MRHFVRFARMSADGSVDRGGWRLRIFVNSREASAFAKGLAGRTWRVETGEYDDGEIGAPTGLARRFLAEVMRAGERARGG